MELMQIRYFLEAASTKHMTNSAKNLHITQPALTQAIRRYRNLPLTQTLPKHRTCRLHTIPQKSLLRVLASARTRRHGNRIGRRKK